MKPASGAFSRDTMSNDSANPLDDRIVHVDQYTGRILADVGFADYGVAGKAMASRHRLPRGRHGAVEPRPGHGLLSVDHLPVGQRLRDVVQASPQGGRPPRRPDGERTRPPLENGAIVMVAVSLLFPLSGAVLVAVLLLDLLVFRHIAPLKKALS